MEMDHNKKNGREDETEGQRLEGWNLRDKPAPTTGIEVDPNVRQLETGCPVHGGDCEVETLEYDKDDDSYLQRCTLTGQTWWSRDNTETWK